MTLRVEDLKVGDVVRRDQTVTDTDGTVALIGGRWCSNLDLAVGNAKKVVRARPVRKGDEIVALTSTGDPLTYSFIAYMPTWPKQRVIAARNAMVEKYAAEGFTHADGSPISWEDSE